jgi:CheY-like chemotaxis protein
MKALRILVVEDDAMIAMLLADMFAAMGHDVCAIERTEAGAVAAATLCKPDLMIVDADWMREVACLPSRRSSALSLCRTFSSVAIFRESGPIDRMRW